MDSDSDWDGRESQPDTSRAQRISVDDIVMGNKEDFERLAAGLKEEARFYKYHEGAVEDSPCADAEEAKTISEYDSMPQDVKAEEVKEFLDRQDLEEIADMVNILGYCKGAFAALVVCIEAYEGGASLEFKDEQLTQLLVVTHMVPRFQFLKGLRNTYMSFGKRSILTKNKRIRVVETTDETGEPSNEH